MIVYCRSLFWSWCCMLILSVVFCTAAALMIPMNLLLHVSINIKVLRCSWDVMMVIFVKREVGYFTLPAVIYHLTNIQQTFLGLHNVQNLTKLCTRLYWWAVFSDITAGLWALLCPLIAFRHFLGGAGLIKTYQTPACIKNDLPGLLIWALGHGCNMDENQWGL